MHVLVADGCMIADAVYRCCFYPLEKRNYEKFMTESLDLFFLELRTLIEEQKADHAVIVFDAEWKMRYGKTSERMRAWYCRKMPEIRNLLHEAGIYAIEPEQGHTERTVCGIAGGVLETGGRVTVASSDPYMLSLVTDKTAVIKVGEEDTDLYEILFTPDLVKEKYGIYPSQIPDLAVFTGSEAAGIKPLDGWKNKAVHLLQEYGTAENAVQNAFSGKENMSHFLRMVRQRKNRFLSVYSEKSPAGWIVWKAGVETAGFYRAARDMKLETTVRMLDCRMLGDGRRPYFAETVEDEDGFPYIDSGTDLSFVLLANRDYEFYTDRRGSRGILAAAAVCFHGRVYYMKPSKGMNEGKIAEKLFHAVSACRTASCFSLKEQFHIMMALSIKHRLKMPFLMSEGKFFDCSVAAYVLNPHMKSYKPHAIAGEFLFLNIPSWSRFLKKHSMTRKAFLDPEPFMDMACLTAWAAGEAGHVLQIRLSEENMDGLFWKIEMPACQVMFWMERDGIQADRRILKECISETEEELARSRFLRTAIEERLSIKFRLMYAESLYDSIKKDGRIHCRFLQNSSFTGRISCEKPNLQNAPAGNIRKIYSGLEPKKGCIFMYADYSQIELRILAHISGDEKLIHAFRIHGDVHKETASHIFHVPVSQVTGIQRQIAKEINYGVIYGISIHHVAEKLGTSIEKAKGYITQYFMAYPKVREYMQSAEEYVKEHGYAVSLSGRKRYIEEIYSVNVKKQQHGKRASINAPIQGTAADIIKIAMAGISQEIYRRKLFSRLILQVHDSILAEVWEDEADEMRLVMKQCMEQAVSLSVPLEVRMKEGMNWKEVQ